MKIDRQKAPYYWAPIPPPKGTKTTRLLGIVNHIPQTGRVKKFFVYGIHIFGTVVRAENLQLVEFGFVGNEIQTRIPA